MLNEIENMDTELINKESERILSKDGTIKYEDLDIIGQGTWNAYKKGFLECFEFLNTPTIEKIKVCTSCLSPKIIDADCICVYDKNYPIVELEFERNRLTGVISDFPADTEFNQELDINH